VSFCIDSAREFAILSRRSRYGWLLLFTVFTEAIMRWDLAT
jgi:hypothetical protein